MLKTDLRIDSVPRVGPEQNTCRVWTGCEPSRAFDIPLAAPWPAQPAGGT